MLENQFTISSFLLRFLIFSGSVFKFLILIPLFLNRFLHYSRLNLDFIPNFLNSILATVSSFGMGLASVLFITFFFLKDQMAYKRMTKSLLPEQHSDRIINSLEKINHLLSRYFIGLLLQLFILFVFYLIVLLIFGVDNAFVIAFLCAVLNIIPYVGPLIASVFAALLTMINNIGGYFQT